MATIVGFISQKGGVGKSTLARALAREAAASGLTVKLADLDTQQGTSTNRHRRRLDAGAEPAFSVEGFKTATQALRVASQFDCMVLDGPARAIAATLEIASEASLVVQPTGGECWQAAAKYLEVVVRFWRDFFPAYLPDPNLPASKHHTD